METKKAMNAPLRQPVQADPHHTLDEDVRRLADVRRGDRGVVLTVSPEGMTAVPHGEREELERQKEKFEQIGEAISKRERN
jgi:hypothetical protein